MPASPAEEKMGLIINACRTGNRKAQETLYQHYFSYGLSIALRYGHDREEARDILQEGFYKVFSGLDHYDPALPFKTWLRRVLINAAIDYLRRYKRRPEELSEDLPPASNSHNDGWEHLQYDDVLAAVCQLSPAYRLVFNLYAIEGFRHREIAEKLSISEGTSKSNYAKARLQLQQYLKNKGIDQSNWYER
ncbi:sigma-70 family RNA polymerase sigma factor [Neolewinella lacunae]|uniref:Sigma-70 family RNA polymerase sigma factor n=1 Tax=Neolewinella lacunae TaxID=1517758 RepID=A0A923PMY8_9BACT|nr:sigma-70 family RNA polymerase sigma factor [Neolewinella lacunae]MBC6995375.1 sigma-70 family RNA polymerase sigma factor [Neolewinella lacunae]MDN3633087.1 sigma-70 family RNA polymerase sigma factor [Neolewinella lacunae]